MYIIHFITLISILNLYLFAQSPLQISDIPSANELNQLFIRTANGEFDPFQVIPMVIDKGDKAVNGLNEFLFQEIADTAAKERANKIYAVLVLDGIGTQAAQQVLYIAALNHPEPEVKGKALDVLSQSLYDRVTEKNQVPDKEVLHIFFQNLDDNRILNDKRIISDIARSGIKNWTGLDFGQLDAEQINSDSKTGEGSEKLKREEWWQANSSKINWNKTTKHFEVRNVN